MTEEELRGMQQHASKILAEFAEKERREKRKTDLDKIKDAFCKAYEEVYQDDDEAIHFYTDRSMWSDFPFKRVPYKTTFSHIVGQAYKDAQKTTNHRLSELLSKAACEPKEKTYSQADMEWTQKAHIEISAENVRLVSEKLRMQKCFEANNEILENTTAELKESQAENELLRATVLSLLNGKDKTGEACEAPEAPEADRERELI